MGNFNNVTVGAGSLSVGGADMGFLKGPVKVGLGHEKLQLKSGVPRRLQGSVITEMRHTIEASMAELSAVTLSRGSGFVPVTVIDGTEVTVADGDDQEKAFSPYQGGGIEAIVLDGPNVTALVVKSQDEMTTYLIDRDYIVDADLGVVFRNPGGTIGTGETVRVSYKYTPPASKRLNIGAQWQVLNLSDVVFTHTRPDGRLFVARMWKAQATGNVDLSFDTEAGDFVMTNFTCEAIEDPTHPEAPLGYWNDEQ